jgi:hypothetical protein
MKHILNDLSNEEKNSIREQHTGGMKVMTENFSRLLNAKLGDAKPLVNEEEIGLSDQSTESLDFNPEELNSTLSPLGITLTPEEMSELQPECEAPYSGPFADVVAKISEKLDTMSLDGLKNTLKQVLSFKDKQPVQEQLAPVIIAGVTIPGAGVAIVLGILAVIILVKIVKAIAGAGGRRGHGGGACKRRRKLVKRFGIDGNFM